jgi:hypothetical protein
LRAHDDEAGDTGDAGGDGEHEQNDEAADDDDGGGDGGGSFC